MAIMVRAPSVAQTGQTVRPLVTVVRKLAFAGRRCAYCGSSEIRPSNRRNALDILLACVFLAPFRCRACRERFYRVRRPSLLHPPDASDPSTEPLLVVPVRRGVLNIDTISPGRIDPAPLQPERHEPAPAWIESPAASAQALPAPGPILILESDLSIRKLLLRLLERRGYFTVEIAQAGDLAVELRDRRAGLLIVDVSAADEPVVNQVIALARAHPSLKMLVLSAEPLSETEVPGRLLALPKPFPLDRFIECVERLLGQSNPAPTGCE
jgi:hypothetical protein